MNTSQWQTAFRIFNAARELPADEQRRFVEAESSDPEITQRVFDQLKALEDDEDESGQGLPASTIDRAGALVGRYRVTSLLGRGGMGEVYAASDAELGRQVALKFLLPQSIGDASAVKRFIREAKAASALNHPNILTVYEVIDSSSGVAIAMELVEGHPLSALRSSTLSCRQAALIGKQVAGALAAAHDQGIVHRDVKPENLMLRPDGLVKVLDFGLARSFGAEAASTFRSSITGLAGTLRYMSPEQLRNEPLTGASDVFSLGLVLYEMATRTHPFESAYVWETAHAIHTQDPPPPSAANPDTPFWLDELILSMLNRDPALRPAARDVESALSRDWSDSRGLWVSKRFWKPATAVLSFAAAAILAWPVLRVLPLSKTSAIAFTQYPGNEDTPSFSPDGQFVAFVWNGPAQDNFDIYVREIGSPSLRRITASPLPDDSPAWSPDGESIAFLRKGAKGSPAMLFIVPAKGGPEREVARISLKYGDPTAALSWTPDGKWLVIPEEGPAGLFLVSSRDGSKKQLTHPPADQSDFSPAVSRDGRTVAFVRSYGEGVPSIYLLPLTSSFLAGGEPQPVPAFYNVGLTTPQWTPDGKELLFVANPPATGMAIWRTRAPEPGKPSQTPRVVYAVPNSKIRLAPPSAAGHRLMYSMPVQESNIWLIPLSASGGAPQARRITPASQDNSDARISPDGSRILYESGHPGYSEIWASNLDGTQTVQLTKLGEPGSGSANWSPDGQRIAFDSRMEGRPHIYLLPATGGRPERLTDVPADNILPAWSKDGRWIYFCSNRSGTIEVWRQPPDGGPAQQMTRLGGWAPTESPDGRSLYYQRRGPTASSLRQLMLATGVDREILPVMMERAFAIAPDGVYYIPLPGPDGRFTIQFRSFESKASRVIATVSKPMPRQLSLAPDGSFLLYSQLDRSGKDLMLVENFH